jgi:hydroxymethylpyrimidine pyrophosphatase-like HAD family hydrolase
MQILRFSKLLYVDVDRTLVMWESGDKWHPHKEHIDLLRQFKYQGHGVIIWSAGGVEWALKAVKLLEIEELVDLVAGKPDWYIDDKSSTEFMPETNRIFLQDLNEESKVKTKEK